MGKKNILIKGTPKSLEKYYFHCPDCGAFWYEEDYKNIQCSYCPTDGCMRLVSVMYKQEADDLIKQMKTNKATECSINNKWLFDVYDIPSTFSDLPNEWRY